ncbi:hypothetical protein Trydic_g8526 [Trypoxylus dichotomus]
MLLATFQVTNIATISLTPQENVTALEFEELAEPHEVQFVEDTAEDEEDNYEDIACVPVEGGSVIGVDCKTRAVDYWKSVGYQHRVNDLEKKFLVWTGKYKRVDDVPALLPASVVERARNLMRIRVANLMILCTVLASVVVCKLGKNARDRGESLQKQNLEWHRKFNEQSRLDKKKEPN